MSSPHLFFSFVQVKSKIIQQLSAIPVETVARVQQVSNVIASASSVIDEVTVEAQVILLVTRHCFAITLGSHSFLKSKVNGLLIHSLNFFFSTERCNGFSCKDDFGIKSGEYSRGKIRLAL